METMGSFDQRNAVFSISFLAAMGKPGSDRYVVTGCLCGTVEAKHLSGYCGSLFAKHHWFDWLIGACLESIVPRARNRLCN